MNMIVEWNENITLPQSLGALEGWMRKSEETARAQVEILLGGASVADLIINILVVGVLAGRDFLPWSSAKALVVRVHKLPCCNMAHCIPVQRIPYPILRIFSTLVAWSVFRLSSLLVRLDIAPGINACHQQQHCGLFNVAVQYIP